LSLRTALRRLCTVSMNGSASSLRRLYDGSTIIARAVAHTIVRTNGFASSLRTALHRLRRLCIVSTTALYRLYDGSTSSLRRLYHCLYNRPYNRPYQRLCIVSTNGPTNSSASSLRTALRRLCTVSTNGSAPCLRPALHRLYDRLCIVSTTSSTTALQSSVRTSPPSSPPSSLQ
jgi:hypothetical protein